MIVNQTVNQIISSFYTVRTVIMQEVLISHTSNLILTLAAIVTLMNFIFNYYIPDKELTNVKNGFVSGVVACWSQYVFRPNLVYKLTNEWVVEDSIYDWYFVRSVELVIATVIVMRLTSYLVRQINVIVREKEVVVLELLKWPKSSILSSDNDEQGPGLSDIPPEVLEKMVAKINRKKIKKEKNQMLKEKRKIKWNEIKTKAIKKAKDGLNIIKNEFKEFRENSTSGESLIIWIIGVNKILYTLMSLMLLYLYLDFGKMGLGLAWRKTSNYLIQSRMDPIKAELMKNNGLNLMYSMGFTLFILAAMISFCFWTMRRDDYSLRNSLMVRTTKFLFRSVMFILALGVVVFVFSDPNPFSVKVVWAIFALAAAKILNKAFLNFILNRAQKVMFHKEYKMMSYQGINEKPGGMTDEKETIESNVIDDDRLLVILKNYFLVKESWKSLIVLENTSYSKNGKESFWLVEKTYRFRYTFFKFTRGLHIRLSVLDSLDNEEERNSPNPGDSSFKTEVEEQLNKHIFISPRGTITSSSGTIKSSETFIDSLKKRGYEVRVLDITAPGDAYNPSEIIKYLERKEREEKQMEEELLQGEED